MEYQPRCCGAPPPIPTAFRQKRIASPTTRLSSPNPPAVPASLQLNVSPPARLSPRPVSYGLPLRTDLTRPLSVKRKDAKEPPRFAQGRGRAGACRCLSGQRGNQALVRPSPPGLKPQARRARCGFDRFGFASDLCAFGSLRLNQPVFCIAVSFQRSAVSENRR